MSYLLSQSVSQEKELQAEMQKADTADSALAMYRRQYQSQIDDTQKKILEIEMRAAEEISRAHRQEFNYAEMVKSES